MCLLVLPCNWMAVWATSGSLLSRASVTAAFCCTRSHAAPSDGLDELGFSPSSSSRRSIPATVYKQTHIKRCNLMYSWVIYIVLPLYLCNDDVFFYLNQKTEYVQVFFFLNTQSHAIFSNKQLKMFDTIKKKTAYCCHLEVKTRIADCLLFDSL